MSAVSKLQFNVYDKIMTDKPSGFDEQSKHVANVEYSYALKIVNFILFFFRKARTSRRYVLKYHSEFQNHV
jgi:hypothetical protein